MSSIYVTNFDSGYLSRAMVLAETFAQFCMEGKLYLFCMDNIAYAVMRELALPRTEAVPHDEFASSELAMLRPLRTVGEYCWTSKPFILEYALAKNPNAEWGVYLDTDMMVLGDLSAPLQAEVDLDALFTPHSLSREFQAFEGHVGRFNAGFAAFRSTNKGRDALREWKRLCVESVSFVPTAQRFADQKYLDIIAAHWRCEPTTPRPGLNAAPWNIGSYMISQDDKTVFVDGDPLLLYHFQGLRVLMDWLYDLYVGMYRLPVPVKRAIYVPYIERLHRAERQLKSRFPKVNKNAPTGIAIFEALRSARRTLNGYGNLMLDL